MSISSLPDAQLRVFARPAAPALEAIRTVYLVGICGTGMGSLAGLLQEAGYAVSGADQAVYPPMSDRLAEAGITVFQGYDPAHLEPAPDLVIIGNACTPTHPEAAAARDRCLVQLSFPEALAHLFLANRRSLVVAGTHGKTTTTGLLVHLLRSAGRDPGFLVGGVMQNVGVSCAVGTGPHFVVEGDEYDSAYFDKRPKFVHYRPTSAIVTSMELDHTDIYPTWEAYRAAFEELTRLVPPEGLLALCGDHEPVRDLAVMARSRVVLYGLDPVNTISCRDRQVDADGQSFTLVSGGRALGRLHLPMHGLHNLSNTLGAVAIALDEGLNFDEIHAGLGSFPGMMRRQEVLGEVRGIRVLDDFAHHPTAVRVTIDAVRDANPGRRLVAVFEPRSNTSRRKAFELAYVDALALADVACLTTPPFRHNDRVEDFLDPDVIVRLLEQLGITAHRTADADDMLAILLHLLVPGDVVLIMSNGGFGGLHRRLLDGLKMGDSRLK
ncbi:MAG: Mur ligase family protein [Rhodothermales bacterium]|nr:Mur ligase family protein [Rhodothermales bacterium]